MEVSSLLTGWTEVLLALTLGALYLYYWWTSSYAYWRQRNVPYLKPTFPFGNVAGVFLMKKNFRESCLDLYNRLKDNPFGGIYSLKSPVLFVKDPKLIKLMLTKDFSYFVDRGFTPKTDHEPLINNIFFMEGDVWKGMRAKLSPAFSSGKLKTMLPILSECSRNLEYCLKDILQNKGSFEAKDLMTRYTFDTIVTCFFGLKATAINDPDCELYKTAKTFFTKSLWRTCSNVMFVEAPNLYSLLKMHLFQYDACQRFADVIKQTIELREKHSISRNDLLDMLIKIRNNIRIDGKDENCELANRPNTTSEKVGNTGKSNDKSKITVEDVMNQILGFFVAGFETSSSGLSFCLYEVGKNPDVQIKMQREIDEAYKRHGGVITYQMLQELPYTDNVLSEALRMYGTLSTLNRLCVKSYRIPDTDVVIEKGCRVIIPLYGIHHDPKYYPDPFKFDPDRFLEENVKSRPAYTFLPFGEGPRICIGMRFAKIQMKMALATLFSKFNIKLNAKTPASLTIAKGELLTRTVEDILIELCDRNDFLPAVPMNPMPIVERLDNKTVTEPLNEIIAEQTSVGPLQSEIIGEPVASSLRDKEAEQSVVGFVDDKTKDQPLFECFSKDTIDHLAVGHVDNKTIYKSVVAYLDNETNDYSASSGLHSKTNNKTHNGLLDDNTKDNLVFLKTNYQPVVDFLESESNNLHVVENLDNGAANDTNNTPTIRQTVIYNKMHVRREILR